MSVISQSSPNVSYVPPNFSYPANKVEKEVYDDFYERTNDYKPSQIRAYGHGANLTNLVAQAREVCTILERFNPFSTHFNTETSEGIQAIQWHLHELSEVKLRVATALDYKRTYYTSSWIGIITRYFLQFFRMWNYGNTAAIVAAEKFLMEWDSRKRRTQFTKDATTIPVKFFSIPVKFFSNVSLSWIHDNKLDASFYNYPKNVSIQAFKAARPPLCI
jgi:hypothetical protein